MSDPVRLSPVPDAPAETRLPRNVEAEAALLGALMIDNRIAEDVQMTLASRAFLRAAAWPHL